MNQFFQEILPELHGLILSYSLVSPKKIAHTLLTIRNRSIRQSLIDSISLQEAEDLFVQELSTLEKRREEALTSYRDHLQIIEYHGGLPPEPPMVKAKTKEEFFQELRLRSIGEVCASLKKKQELLDSKLNRAIEENSFQRAEEAIRDGADVDTTFGDGLLRTPLMMSFYYQRTAITRLLLNSGASAKRRDREGKTPLMYACMLLMVDLSFIDELLLRGADINEASTTGRSPLLIAAESYAGDTVAHLIQKSADVNFVGRSKNTPLLVCCSNGDWKNVRLIVEKGVNINHQNNAGKTPLSYAILRNNLEMTEYLLEKGATPLLDNLIDSVVYGSIKSFLALLEHYKETLSESTLMVAAVKSGDLRYVQALLEKGCDINVRDNEGVTPLSIAVSASGYVCKFNGGDKYSVASFLLERGADPDIPDNSRVSPMAKAITLGDIEMSRLLLEKGLSKISRREAYETAKKSLHQTKGFSLNRDIDNVLLIMDYFSDSGKDLEECESLLKD